MHLYSNFSKSDMIFRSEDVSPKPTCNTQILADSGFTAIIFQEMFRTFIVFIVALIINERFIQRIRADMNFLVLPGCISIIFWSPVNKSTILWHLPHLENPGNVQNVKIVRWYNIHYYNILLATNLTFYTTFISALMSILYSIFCPLFQCFNNYCGVLITMIKLLSEMVRQLLWWNEETTAMVKRWNVQKLQWWNVEISSMR